MSNKLRDVTGNITVRSPKTEKALYKKGCELMKKYERERGCSWKENPVLCIEWWIQRKPRYTKKTWIYYKLSLVEFMKCHGPIEAVDYLETHDSKQKCKKRGENKQTSSKKQKCIKPEDIQQLINAIDDILNEAVNTRQRADGMWHTLQLFIKISPLIGLRPVEYSRAKLNKTRSVLIVKNAKNSNSRSHGMCRRIHLLKFSDEEKDDLQELLLDIQADDSVRYMKNMSSRLHELGHSEFTNGKSVPSYYTFRHQFVANAKSFGLSKAQLAALLGHKNTRTAGQHYARSGKGFAEQFKVGADVRDIARIIEVSEPSDYNFSSKANDNGPSFG